MTVLAGHLGATIRMERQRHRWSIRHLAALAALSPSHVHMVETGRAGSVETYVRLAAALGLRPEMALIDPRRAPTRRDEDPVHAAMGEAFARLLGGHGFELSLDEPYQHFQFAGRADVVAWSIERAALVHVENKTRLPNFQDAVGSFNAKRRWLAPSIAERLGMRRGFRSVTHVLALLWSGEMLRTVRVRHASLLAICPGSPAPIEAWLAGSPPEAGVSSSCVLFDPAPEPRPQRPPLVGLAALTATAVRGRYRDYVEALQELREAGLT